MPDLPKMRTVGDIVDLIYKNLQSDDKTLSKHAVSLLGPRVRGSTTAYGIDDPDFWLFPVTPVDDEHVADGCQCYMFKCYAMCGVVQAMSLEQALSEGLPVSLRNGDHGFELFVDRSVDQIEEHSDLEHRIYVIIGWHDEEPAVFTWHPGQPLSPLSEGIKPSTAVKLHNG